MKSGGSPGDEFEGGYHDRRRDSHRDRRDRDTEGRQRGQRRNRDYDRDGTRRRERDRMQERRTSSDRSTTGHGRERSWSGERELEEPSASPPAASLATQNTSPSPFVPRFGRREVATSLSQGGTIDVIQEEAARMKRGAIETLMNVANLPIAQVGQLLKPGVKKALPSLFSLYSSHGQTDTTRPTESDLGR